MRTHEVGLLGRQEKPGSSWTEETSEYMIQGKKHYMEKINTFPKQRKRVVNQLNSM